MSDLWWGLLLSVPVGIGVNLISGPISRSLSNRNQKAAAKKAAEDAQFSAQIQRYAKNRNTFYSYLLEQLIRLAWIGSLFGLIAGLLAVGGQVLIASELWLQDFTDSHLAAYNASNVFNLSSQVVALLGTIIVLNIARRALLTVRGVNQLGNEHQTLSNPPA